MLRDYIRQLLALIFIVTSITANGQGFGVSTSARYADGCRLDFYNSTNVKIFSLRGSELRYTYNSSGQIIVRDENTQITDVFGISGLADLIDSVQSICLAGLCSGGSTPVETYSYCGAPVWDWWINQVGTNDTLKFFFNNRCLNYIDGILYVRPSGSDNLSTSFTYPYGYCMLRDNCDIEACTNSIGLECSQFDYFNVAINEVAYSDTETFCLPRTISTTIYSTVCIEGDTSLLYTESNTLSNDTTQKQDVFIPVGGDNNTIIRILGVVYSGIVFDSTNATIEITAKPVKTSGQTYAASSFKIEKIAFADIGAPVISGSTYNPNSGEQSNTFSLTTGKNTFKVSVEDTDGNIAYTIFQVSKTAL